MPFSTAGIYSLGIAPPTIASSKTKPAPFSLGSISISTSPYWPLPPDWRTKRWRARAGRVIVSR